ncbi:MAG: diguanylate cyclase [Cyanobacteria bacterium P01_H01_bin.121]
MNSPFNTYQMPVIEASEGVAAFESIESLKVLCAQALDQKMADLLQQKAQLELENRELRRLANTDELTQVANRRFFDQQLQQEWQRLRRDRQVCSLILLDIDYFKRYNDFYGHQAGDSCLMQIAKAIQGAVKRPADFVARYGGEEFAIVLPNTCTAGALAVAERVQQAIEAQKISHEQSDISQFVTVSMGVSSLMPTVEGCVEMLIARADAALYTAKQLGRKRYYPYLDSVELES